MQYSPRLAAPQSAVPVQRATQVRFTHTRPPLHVASVVHSFRGWSTQAPTWHCWPLAQSEFPEHPARHCWFTHTRPAPHWLLNWHVSELATQAPATQTRPAPPQSAVARHAQDELAAQTGLLAHAPFTHTPPLQSVLLMHDAVGRGVAVSVGVAQKLVVPMVRHTQPRGQLSSLVQPGVQPRLVQMYPAVVQSRFPMHAVRVGGCATRHPTPSQ